MITPLEVSTEEKPIGYIFRFEKIVEFCIKKLLG